MAISGKKESDLQRNKEKMNAKELQQAGVAFFEKCDYRNSREYTLDAIKKIETEKLSEDEKNLFFTECYFNLGKCKLVIDDIEDAIKYFEKADGYANKIAANNKELIDIKFSITLELGIVYLKGKKYNSAEKYFVKAKESNQTSHIALAKSFRGLCFAFTNKLNEAMQEHKEATEFFSQSERQISLNFALHVFNRGLVCESNREYKKAYDEFELSLQLREQNIHSGKKESYFYRNCVGNSLAGMGRACFELKEWTKAEEHLQKALKHFTILKAAEKVKKITELLIEISKQTKTFTISPSGCVALKRSGTFGEQPQQGNTTKNGHTASGLKLNSDN